jgi:hypothetical protein
MEPERKIEKLLRAYARKRRADAGEAFTLPPAARRRLQGEIARRQAEPPEEDELSLWQLFRQQWAVLAGFALLIFFCAMLLLPALNNAKIKSQKLVALSQLKQIGLAIQTTAAENNGRLPATLDALTNGLASEKTLTDPASGQRFIFAAGGQNLDELESNSVLVYSPAEKKSRAVLLADGSVQTLSVEQFDEMNRRGLVQRVAPLELAAKQREIVAQNQLADNRPVPAAAPAPATGALTAGGTGNPSAGEKNDFGHGVDGSLAVAGLPAAPAANAAGETALTQPKLFFKTEDRASAAQSGLNKNSQRFVQTMSASAKPMSLLATFELQQAGDVISVVDQDGSVYQGSLLPQNQTPQNKDSNVAGTVAANAQNVFFRVSGQNRASKQNVVFSGNLIPLTAPILSKVQPTPQENNSTAPGELPQAAIRQAAGKLINNSRISGIVTVDATNEIEINAVPTTP